MSELPNFARAAAHHAIAGVLADIALHRCGVSAGLVDSIVDAVAVHTTLQPPKPDRYELSDDERAAALAAIEWRIAPWRRDGLLDEMIAAINEARGFRNV